MRSNLPEIRFPVTPPGANAAPRDYFVDGAVTVYEKRDAAKAIERVVLYVTMRRGGRFLYAFDVTDPAAPKMLWRKSNSTLSVLGRLGRQRVSRRLRERARIVRRDRLDHHEVRIAWRLGPKVLLRAGSRADADVHRDHAGLGRPRAAAPAVHRRPLLHAARLLD